MLQERLERVDQLVQTLKQSSDETARAAAQELMQTLLALHRGGLERMLTLLREDDGAALDRFAQDELVCNVLLLHGLHPVDLGERIATALDRARPFLRSYHCDVELLEITAEAVRLRLQLGDDTPLSMRYAFRHTIEEAILEAAPDVAKVELAGFDPEPRISLPVISNGRDATTRS